MAPSTRTWRLTGALVVACCLGIAGAAHAQFNAFSDHTGALLEGNWQSCREADGHYSERVYDGKVADLGPFEFHMGPNHEFALFRGVQDEHRDHGAPENLLRPYNVEVVGNLAKQHWEVAGLRVDVVLAGGSREECESWFVALRRIDTSSSR